MLEEKQGSFLNPGPEAEAETDHADNEVESNDMLDFRERSGEANDMPGTEDGVEDTEAAVPFPGPEPDEDCQFQREEYPDPPTGYSRQSWSSFYLWNNPTIRGYNHSSLT